MTAGELWTREVLAELRADRYSPAAWRRFLARSYTRAAQVRARRTHEHGQLLGFAAVVIAGWGAVAVSGRPWLALGGGAWLVVLVTMVDWHLGMLEDGSGRKLRGLGPANLVSLLRGALVPALLVVPPMAFLALLLCVGLGDAVDGPLARRRGQSSRLGRFLAAGVDAFVVGAAAVAAGRLGLLPWWTAGLVLLRYALQWVGLALAYAAGNGVLAPDGFMPWKLPGPILFAGLGLAAAHLDAAVTVVTVGAITGLATLAASGLRSLRPQVTPG